MIVKVDRFEQNDVPVCPVVLDTKSSILPKPSFGLHGPVPTLGPLAKSSAEETFQAFSKAGYTNWAGPLK